MPRTKSQTTVIKELQSENDALRKELTELKQRVGRTKRPVKQPGRFWRRLGVVGCVSLATALLVAGNLLFWAGRTIIDPARFNAVASPLVAAPEIQQTIAQNVSNQLFERVDVQQLLAENLPERVAFAAPAIASQVQSATQTALVRLMQNESFQQTWNSSVEAIHTRFIDFVRNYQGDGVLQVSDIYNKLVARLADTKLSFLSGVSLPPQIGSITIAHAPWLPVAHNIVNNIDVYRVMTTILFVACIALAIWLSRRKRRTAVIIGVTFAIFMVLTLVAVRITEQQIIASFAAANQPAVQVVVDTLLESLLLQTRVLFMIGLLLSCVAWIGGSSKGATLLRSRIQVLFGGNLHGALFGGRENRFTRWVARHKRLLEWLFVGLATFVIVTSPLNMMTLLVVAVLLVLAVLLIELVAAPTEALTDATQ